MVAVFHQCADCISEAAKGKIDLFGLLQAFSLHFALKDLLAASEID